MPSILEGYGIQKADWMNIGKFLGLESHILATAFFKKWIAHAHACNPSWEKLAWALENMRPYKTAAITFREKMAGV